MAKSRKIPYPSDSTMSLGDHLEELRTRLIYAIIGIGICSIIGLCFAKQLIDYMEKPYVEATAYVHSSDPNAAPVQATRLQTLSPPDGFVSFVKIGLIAGLILSSPWVFYHLWMFVAAGLYRHERKYIYLAMPFTVILFIGGITFFMFIVAPITLKFLIKFNQNMLGVESRFTFQFYLSFITRLMLIFGFAFQTPTAIFFLNKAGLVSIQALQHSRKFVLLATFIVAAMITPPDVVSQITLAVPLYILFELGIVISYIFNRKR